MKERPRALLEDKIMARDLRKNGLEIVRARHTCGMVWMNC